MTLPRRLSQLLDDVRTLNDELRRTEPLAQASLSTALEALEAGRVAVESVVRLAPAAREVQALTGTITDQVQQSAEAVLQMGGGSREGGADGQTTGSRLGVETQGVLASSSASSQRGTPEAGGGTERGGSLSVFGGLAPRPTATVGPPTIVDATGGAADPSFALGSQAPGKAAPGKAAPEVSPERVAQAVAKVGDALARQLEQATSELRQVQAETAAAQGRQLTALQQQQTVLARRLERGPSLDFELRAAGGLL